MKKLYDKFCIWIVKVFGKKYYITLVEQNALLVKELNEANEKILSLSK